MKPSIRFFAGLAAALVLFALPAAAQNLLSNPRFDTDLSGWSYDPNAVQWSNRDAKGSSASGSARVSNGSSNMSGVYLTSPCVSLPITMTLYDVAAKVLVPSGQDQTGSVKAYLREFSSKDCSEGTLGTVPLTAPPAGDFDEWASISGYGNPIGYNGSFGLVPPPPPPPGYSAQIIVEVVKDNTSPRALTAYFDDFLFRKSTCASDAHTLCLNGARFKVAADWETATSSGHAAGSQLSNDTGVFSFFGSDNTELVVKVLDACADPFNRFWVFGAGLTNVLVTLTVEDTQTGTVRTYVNPQGAAFQPIQDTAAFATCP